MLSPLKNSRILWGFKLPLNHQSHSIFISQLDQEVHLSGSLACNTFPSVLNFTFLNQRGFLEAAWLSGKDVGDMARAPGCKSGLVGAWLGNREGTAYRLWLSTLPLKKLSPPVWLGGCENYIIWYTKNAWESMKGLFNTYWMNLNVYHNSGSLSGTGIKT